MINNELLKKLNAMSAEVEKLESEAKRTTDNINKQIAESRSEKEVKIVEFLHTLEETFKVGKFPIGKQYFYLCCGTHWEGEPGACGSHGRSIAVTFRADREGRVPICFGRYFSSPSAGGGYVDNVLYAGTRRLEKSYTSSQYECEIARGLRENIIDRWTEETERGLSEWMIDIVKTNLKKRLSEATAELKKANDKHDEYFGGK